MFGYSAISPTLLIAIAVAAMGTITVITISLVSKRHQQKYIAIGEINAVADIMRQLGQAATLIPGREVAYLDVAGRMITDSIEGAHEAIVVRQNKGGAPTTSTQEKIDIKAFCQIAPRLAEEKVTWLEKKDIRSLGITWRHALVLCLSDADERRYFVIPSMGMPRKKLDAILALLQTTMEANYALRTHARDVLVARVINDRLNTQFITFWKVLSGLIHNIKGTFAPISTRIKMTVDLLDASTPFTADKLENVIRQSAVPIPTLNQMLDLIGQKMRAFIDRPDIIKENVEAHNLQSLFAHCFTNWLEREVELSKLSLSVDIPEHLYVLVEETSFFQCVWNVLRNAFRYTKNTFPG